MSIELTQMKSEPTLAFQSPATMDNLVEIMDKGINGVQDYLKAQGIAPAGPPYAAYHNVKEGSDFANFDLELGFPVSGPVPVKEGLFLSKTYEGRAVVSTHKGPYPTLEETYCAVMKFIEDNALVPTGVYYDHYLNDPEVTPEAELLTKVVIPVKE